MPIRFMATSQTGLRLAFARAANGKNVVGRRMHSWMYGLLYHREGEDYVEESLEQCFELRRAARKSVAVLLGGRGLLCLLRRTAAHDEDVMAAAERIAQVANEGILVAARNVLDRVEAVNRIMPSRQRPEQDVVRVRPAEHIRWQLPLELGERCGPGAIGGELCDGTHDHGGSERLGPAIFGDIMARLEQAGNEAIPRERTRERDRISRRRRGRLSTRARCKVRQRRMLAAGSAQDQKDARPRTAWHGGRRANGEVCRQRKQADRQRRQREHQYMQWRAPAQRIADPCNPQHRAMYRPAQAARRNIVDSRNPRRRVEQARRIAGECAGEICCMPMPAVVGGEDHDLPAALEQWTAASDELVTARQHILRDDNQTRVEASDQRKIDVPR